MKDDKKDNSPENEMAEIENLFNLYVLLYSEKQGVFHIETLGQCVENNIRNVLNNFRKQEPVPDFILIGVGTLDAVEELAEIFKRKRAELMN